VRNKGWYIAKLTVFYRRLTESKNAILKLTKSIAISQDHTFVLPSDIDLEYAYLVAHAIAGIEIMKVKIVKTPECFHVWGTTLIPYWSYMLCW
jgi:hypothetical protein